VRFYNNRKVQQRFGNKQFRRRCARNRMDFRGAATASRLLVRGQDRPCRAGGSRPVSLDFRQENSWADDRVGDRGWRTRVVTARAKTEYRQRMVTRGAVMWWVAAIARARQDRAKGQGGRQGLPAEGWRQGWDGDFGPRRPNRASQMRGQRWAAGKNKLNTKLNKKLLNLIEKNRRRAP